MSWSSTELPPEPPSPLLQRTWQTMATACFKQKVPVQSNHPQTPVLAAKWWQEWRLSLLLRPADVPLQEEALREEGEEWSSAISAGAHRYIVATLHGLYPRKPQNLDNFSPLQPWSQPWFISENLTIFTFSPSPFPLSFICSHLNHQLLICLQGGKTNPNLYF